MNSNAIPGTETKALVPVAPKEATSEEIKELQGKAGDIIVQLQSGKEDRNFLNGVMNLGIEAQRDSARKLDLLKVRVGTLMNTLEGEGAQIPKDLSHLRVVLDQINPNIMKQPGLWSRLIGKLPGIGERLKEISIRYESVQTQIDAIVANLREGNDTLLRDNISLEQLYDDVKSQQVVVQKNAFLGEVLLEKLGKFYETVTDPTEQQKLNTLMHALAMRIEDLRTIEQVNMQFFISIDLTTNNNRLLGQSVERTLTIAVNVITVGLAIQAALVNQKNVLEATKATEYAGNILVANAKAIGQNTKDIGALYTDPALALEKVQTAYNELISAIDETERIKKIGLEKAKEGIGKLAQMSEKLQEKVDSVHATNLKQIAPASIEA